MDKEAIAFYRSVYSDLSVDNEEADALTEFLQKVNPPPDKLLWLRLTAFKIASEFLSDSKESNITLFRTVNYIVHAIEQTCMEPAELDNTVPLNEDDLSEFYRGVFDELNIDADETQQIDKYFKESNPPESQDLVATRALAFKVACECISDDDADHNTNLLKCINTVIHSFECSCLKPKTFQLQISDSVDMSMSLSEAVQHLWTVDANRLTFGEDFVLNVQEGKKPFWKEDGANDPLFTSVDKMVWRRPTYQAFVALLDNYSSETGQEEVLSDSERSEVSSFLNAVYETGPVQFCHKYCHSKDPSNIPEDKEGFIALLKSTWFELYHRSRGGREDSSGFEHVFVGEVKDGEVSGFHNWIQFYLEEQKGTVDYRGYIKPRGNGAEHNDDDYLLSLQFSWNGVEKFVGTSFIGVSPEFEFALYTMCFLVGEEENHVSICTGSDTFEVTIKCYKMDGSKVGTTFPEVTEHYDS
jgi:poly(U)-specific endoribonuclease